MEYYISLEESPKIIYGHLHLVKFCRHEELDYSGLTNTSIAKAPLYLSLSKIQV